MLFLRQLVVAVFIGATCAVAAFPQESNSQRLARGLPPLPPKFGRNRPGYPIQYYNPTPVSGAKRSTTSATPFVSYTGRLEVRADNGTSLGYVKAINATSPSWSIVGGINFLGNTSGHDLRIKFHGTASGNGRFDIVATNDYLQASPSLYHYIGATGKSISDNLAIASPNIVRLSNTTQSTPASSPPVPQLVSNNDEEGIESAIWSIDPNTKQVTAHYVNPDGTQPQTIIGYNVQEDSFFFTGDIITYNKFQAQNSTSASPISEAVTLYILEDGVTA